MRIGKPERNVKDLSDLKISESDVVFVNMTI